MELLVGLGRNVDATADQSRNASKRLVRNPSTASAFVSVVRGQIWAIWRNPSRVPERVDERIVGREDGGSLTGAGSTT